jgi:hypothetical protein
MTKLATGVRVYWTDPDNGFCSGPAIVIDCPPEPIDDEDRIALEMTESGALVEAFPRELRILPIPFWGGTAEPWTVVPISGLEGSYFLVEAKDATGREDEANARLMQAAPKLVDLLNRMLQDAESVGPGCDAIVSQAMLDDAKELLKQIAGEGEGE